MNLRALLDEAQELPGLHDVTGLSEDQATVFYQKAVRRGDKEAAAYWAKIIQQAKVAAKSATKTVGHSAKKAGTALAKGALALAKGDPHHYHHGDHGHADAGETRLWDRLKSVGKSIKDAPKNVKRMLTDKDYRAEVGKKVGGALKKKAKTAWGMVKHEAHEFKVAGKALKKLAKREKLNDDDKKAMKAAAKALAVTVIGTAAMGGIGHLTLGAMAKHFAAETALKAVGRAALFASVHLHEEDAAVMARWAEAVMNSVADEFDKLGEMDPEDVAKLIADVEYTGEDSEDTTEETTEMQSGYFARVSARLAEAISSGTVETFLMVLRSKLTQYDKRLGSGESKRGGMPNIYRIGHYLKAAQDVEDAVSSIKTKDDPESLQSLKRAIAQSFGATMPPAKATLKQIDDYIASGKKPTLK